MNDVLIPQTRNDLGAQESPARTFGRRMLSWFIDGVFLTIVLVVLNFIIYGLVVPAEATETDPAWDTAFLWSILTVILVPLTYSALSEGVRGQTLGKMVARLEVRDREGRRVGFVVAFFRALAKGFSLLAFGLGVLWILFSRSRRAWHDIIAGTFVVPLADDELRPGSYSAPFAAQSGQAPVQDPAPEPSPSPAEAPAAQPLPMGLEEYQELLTLAESLSANRRWLESVSLLGSALAANPDSDEIRFELAYACYKGGLHRDALELSTSLMVRNPNHALAMALRGATLAWMGGDLANAFSLVDRARELAPSSYFPHLVASHIHVFAKDFSRAEAAAREALRFGPDRVDAWLGRAFIHEEQGRWELAEQSWEKACELSPDDPVLLAGRGRALTMAKRKVEAAPLLARSLALEPQNNEAAICLREGNKWAAKRSPIKWLFPLMWWVVGGPVFALFNSFGGPIAGWSGAVGVVGGAFVFWMYKRSRRRSAIGPDALAWLDYLQHLEVNADRAKGTIKLPIREPVAPSSSPLGDPSQCRCSQVRALYADLAVAYGRMHLGHLRNLPAIRAMEFVCPDTQTHWLAFDRGAVSDAIPTILVRVDEPAEARVESKARVGFYL